MDHSSPCDTHPYIDVNERRTSGLTEEELIQVHPLHISPPWMITSLLFKSLFLSSDRLGKLYCVGKYCLQFLPSSCVVILLSCKLHPPDRSPLQINSQATPCRILCLACAAMNSKCQQELSWHHSITRLSLFTTTSHHHHLYILFSPP